MTKMRLLLLLLPLNTLVLMAQSDGGFGLSGGLTYDYRAFLPDGNLVHEIPRINYHFGIKYLYPLGEKWAIEAGMGIRHSGYSSEKKKLTWGSEIDPISGETIFDPSLPHELQFIKIYRFLEIPLIVRHYFGASNKHYLKLGLSNNAYLSSKLITTTDLSSEKEQLRDSRIRDFHLAAQVGFGWQWPIRKSGKMFSLSPDLRLHLSNLNKEGPLKEHPYSGGVSLGFWW